MSTIETLEIFLLDSLD